MFHMWDFGTGTGWWMGFGIIWLVLFWGGLIALVTWIIRKVIGTGNRDSYRESSAMDIARERYARGEITREEFHRIKETLSKNFTG